MLIQGTVDAAVHEQPSPVITVNDPGPASFVNAASGGESSVAHGTSAAASRIRTTTPPMVRVPARVSVVGLAATEIATEPLPSPDVPRVIEIQLWSETAVHAQRSPAVTVTSAVPPPALSSIVVAESEKVQGVGPGCVGDDVAHAARRPRMPASMTRKRRGGVLCIARLRCGKRATKQPHSGGVFIGLMKATAGTPACAGAGRCGLTGTAY